MTDQVKKWHWQRVTRSTITYAFGLGLLVSQAVSSGPEKLGLIGAALWCLGLPSAEALAVMHRSPPGSGFYRVPRDDDHHERSDR